DAGDLTKKYPPPDPDDPLSFFAELDRALTENPPPAHHAELLKLFERVGVGTGKEFRADRLDAPTRAGLLRAVRDGLQTIADRADHPGTRVNGWDVLPAAVGEYGDDYLLRATVAKFALAANSPAEAVYPTAYVDGDGRTLSGANRYVLRFDKGRL